MTDKILNNYPQFINVNTIIFDFGGVVVNLNIDQCIQKISDLGVVNVEQFLSNYGQKEIGRAHV